MQIITTIASAAALIATVSAVPASDAQAFNLNSTCVESEPKVRIYNRCPYKVYLWSVLTGLACPAESGAVVNPGEFYQENYRPAVGGIGTSIKISKNLDCSPKDLLQLEYFIETQKPGYNYNYLDVSYVNCETKKCATAQEGFYLKSGNVDGKFAANSLNNICPILSCGTWEECSKVAYVNWDDVQTRSCDPNADLDFYMCGSEAPGASDPVPVLAPSSVAALSSAPAAAPSSTEDAEPTYAPVEYSSEVEVEAAAITSAPAAYTPKAPHVKTEIVYVTAIEYVEAKRHVHGHRHQHFNA